jgi:hypothetical protein
MRFWRRTPSALDERPRSSEHPDGLNGRNNRSFESMRALAGPGRFALHSRHASEAPSEVTQLKGPADDMPHEVRRSESFEVELIGRRTRANQGGPTRCNGIASGCEAQYDAE